MHKLFEFIVINSTYFGNFLCPTSAVFYCTFGTCKFHETLMTASKQSPDGPDSSLFCLEAVIKPVWNLPLLKVQYKTPDDGQRRCPKHVEFYNRINLNNLCIWLWKGTFIFPWSAWLGMLGVCGSFLVIFAFISVCIFHFFLKYVVSSM